MHRHCEQVVALPMAYVPGRQAAFWLPSFAGQAYLEGRRLFSGLATEVSCPGANPAGHGEHCELEVADHNPAGQATTVATVVEGQ